MKRACSLLALVLLLPLACQKPQPEEINSPYVVEEPGVEKPEVSPANELDPLIASLIRDDARRADTIDSLMRMGPEAVPLLEGYLFHKNREVAFRCGDVLIKIERARLEKVRDEADPDLLEQIKANAMVAMAPLPTDSKRIWQQARAERRAAIQFLLDTGEPAILDLAEVIAGIMQTFDPEEKWDVAEAHMEVLNQLRRNIPIAARALRMAVVLSDDPDVARAAMRNGTILGMLASAKAYDARTDNISSVPYLRKISTRSDQAVKEDAAILLVKNFADPHVADILLNLASNYEKDKTEAAAWLLLMVLEHPQAPKLILDRMRHTDPEIRASGVGMARISRRAEFLPEIKNAMYDKNPKVREQAVMVFVFMPSKNLERDLVEAVRREKNDGVLSNALGYMQYFKSPENEELVREKVQTLLRRVPLVANKNNTFNASAEHVVPGIRTLGAYGYSSSQPLLREALKCRFWVIQAAAADALVRCGDDTGLQQLWNVFEQIKESPPRVPASRIPVYTLPRMRVAQMLLELGEIDVIEKLLNSYKRGNALDLRIAQTLTAKYMTDPQEQQRIARMNDDFVEWWHTRKRTYYREVVEQKLRHLENGEGHPMPVGWLLDIALVRQLTGKAFGYNPMDLSDKRAMALRRWRDWIAKNKARLVWDASKRRLAISNAIQQPAPKHEGR